MAAAQVIGTLLQRFGRVTSSGHFIPQIDGLRFLAILLVIGHHIFAGYLEQTHRLGTQQLPRDWALIYPRSSLIAWGLHLAVGVPLFCVISGFVLTVPFAQSFRAGSPRPSRKVYFLRRLVRLEPPYVLSLIFLFLVIVIPWQQADPVKYFLAFFRAFGPHLAASLAYLHGAIYGQASWINGVAWTLEIEVQFYVLLPFIAELFRIRHNHIRRSVWIALVLAAALLSQFVVQPSGNPRLTLSLAIQAQFFLAGVLLADIYVDLPRALRSIPLAADGLALLSAALLIYVLHWKSRLAWTEPFLMIGFYFGAFYGTWTSRLFRLPALTLLGGISYTVFLYHFFIVRQLLPFTVEFFPPVHALWWDIAVQFLVLTPVIFVFSAFLYLLAEKPFMVLSRDVSRRFRPEARANVVGA